MNDIGRQIESGSDGPEWARRTHDLAQGVATSMQRTQAEINRTDLLSRQNVLLKTLLTRELMRREAPRETVYTAFELDHAAQKASGLVIEPDGKGNYLAEFQS